MTNHEFCRLMERGEREEAGLFQRDFSVCALSCGHMHVQGPGGFDHYARTCCKWAARIEAYQAFVRERLED